MGVAGDPMLPHHSYEEAVGRPLFLIPGMYIKQRSNLIMFMNLSILDFRDAKIAPK
jgi:hypothetical protein